VLGTSVKWRKGARSDGYSTTHPRFSEWATVLGDAKMTTALLDRLTHHCPNLESGKDCLHFKASSAAATQKKKEVNPPLPKA